MWKEQRWAPTSIRVLTARNYSSRPAVRTKLQGDTLRLVKSPTKSARRDRPGKKSGRPIGDCRRAAAAARKSPGGKQNFENAVARVYIPLINIYETRALYDKITNARANSSPRLLESKLDLRVTNPADVKTATNFSYESVGFLLYSWSFNYCGRARVCLTNIRIGNNMSTHLFASFERYNTCGRSH